MAPRANSSSNRIVKPPKKTTVIDTPPVIKVRRWMGPEKKIVYVFLGCSKPPFFSLLKALEQRQAKATALSKMELSGLEKSYGKNYQQVLSLSEVASGGVKYVNDALFLDDSVTAVKHQIMRVALGDEAATMNERLFDDLYLWVSRSVSPCRERSVMLVRETLKGRVTIDIDELSREFARIKYGFFDKTRHSLRSLIATGARFVTASHALKLVDEAGGIDHLTYPVGHALYESPSHNYRVFFDHHPYKISSYGDPRQRGSTNNKYVSTFPHDAGSDALFVEYENDRLLGSYMGRHEYKISTGEVDFGVPTLNVTTLREVTAFFRRSLQQQLPSLPLSSSGNRDDVLGIWTSVYFPMKRGMSLGSVEVADMVQAEREILRSWGHDTERSVSIKTSKSEPLQLTVGFSLLHLRTHAFLEGSHVSPSTSYFTSIGLVNLEAIFNLFVTNTCVPLVKIYDGNVSLYKVSRMALHKNVVDAGWVAGNFAKRGKSKNASPYLQFIVRLSSESSSTVPSSDTTMRRHDDGGTRRTAVPHYFKVMVTSEGRVDLMCSFSVNDPADIHALHACIASANDSVIDPLNVLISQSSPDGSVVSFRKFDAGALTKDDDYVPSETCVMNIVSCSNVVITGTRDNNDDTPPHLNAVAAVMNQLEPYFTLIVRLPPVVGEGVSAVYKRTKNASITDNMSYAVAIHTMSVVFGMNKEQMIPAVSKRFLVSREMAEQKITDYQQGRFRSELHAIISQHYMPHAPTLQVKPLPKGDGFRVFTVQMTNIVHILRSVDICRKVIQVAGYTPRRELERLRSVAAYPLLSYPSHSNSSSMSNTTARDENDYSGSEDVLGTYAEDEAYETDPSAMLFESKLEDILSEEDAMSALTSSKSSEMRAMDDETTTGAVRSANSSSENNNNEKNGLGAATDKYNILEDLKRADPDLFDNRSVHKGPRYATTCGSAPMRQPIVVTSKELDRIHRESPDSYAGTAIAYGSTPELAEKNRYICPKVWCPRSRMSLTAEQFKARGSKCFLEGEEPMIFENNYWKGNPRYPGLLGSTKHPTGLCMPCCFLKNFKNMHQCGDQHFLPSSASGSRSVEHDGETSSASSASEIAIDLKYIKGDTLQLEMNRYGMLPSSLLNVFNGHPLKCGSRDDGSGQFTNNTDCFVRKGVYRARQSFLQCMASILRLRNADEVVLRIFDNLSPEVYISMNNGLVCRMFMDQQTALFGEATKATAAAISDNQEQRKQRLLPRGDGDKDKGIDRDRDRMSGDLSFSEFVEAFLRETSYIDKMHLGHLAEMLKKFRHDARYHPEVRREWMIFKSMRRFLAYLTDDGIVKEHKVLLGLFNRQLPWLNSEGLNILVFEQGLEYPVKGGTPANMDVTANDFSSTNTGDSSKDMLVDCEGIGRDMSSIRFSHPFVFIVKQDVFYEPIHRVRSKTSKNRGKLESTRGGSSGATSSSSLDSVPLTKTGVVDENRFMYDTNFNVRSIVDAVFKGCGLHHDQTVASRRQHDDEDKSPRRLCNSGACLDAFIRGVLRLRVSAQVIDFSFRLMGFVTQNSVFVPLHGTESMLVGEYAPPRVMYISEVYKLKPVFVASDRSKYTSGGRSSSKRNSIVSRNTVAESLAQLFGTLAELTMDDRYSVSHVLKNDAGLVLSGGQVIPVALEPTEDDHDRGTADNFFGRYMENLNVMIGKRLPDERVRYIDDTRAKVKARDIDLSTIARKLEENTSSLHEFFFLRSAFNPFPMWYKTQRMRALLEGLRLPEGIINDSLVDSLLYGTDPFRHFERGKSTDMNRKLRNMRSSASSKPDLIISEYDILNGAWIRRIQSVAINPFSSEEDRSIDLRDPRVSRLAVVKSVKLSLLKVPLIDESYSSSIDSSTELVTSPCDRRSSSYKSVSTSSELAQKDLISRGNPVPFSGSRSSSSKKRRQHGIVSSCGVWQVFHVVSMLVTRGSIAIPISSMRHVVANSLISDLRRMQTARSSKTDALMLATFSALMEDHPSFSLHWKSSSAPSSAGHRRRQQQSTMIQHTDPFSLIPLFMAQLESPNYVAGMYDIYILARLCDVKCDVLSLMDERSSMRSIGYGVHKKTDPQMVEVPGIPPANVSFNGDSDTVDRALLLIYRHDTVPSDRRVDVITDRDGILFDMQ